MKQFFFITFCFFIKCSYAQIDTSAYVTSPGHISITLTNSNYHEVKNQVLKFKEKQLHYRVFLIDLVGSYDSIPEFISTFSNLKDLFINSSKKIDLDEKLNKLENLLSIRIIIELSSISTSLLLTKIEYFHVAIYTGNKFPEAICNWINLKDLDFQGGNFSTLPKDIGNLKKIKVINLSDNKIKTLPTEIGKLEKLEVLSVDGNCLTSIPNSICNLQNLRELYILHNPKLKLTGNQIKCIKALPKFENLFDK